MRHVTDADIQTIERKLIQTMDIIVSKKKADCVCQTTKSEVRSKRFENFRQVLVLFQYMINVEITRICVLI